ncbi:hypothetical protein [Allorhodopirellula heiligendammensis]|nr:hypothetical protein [Allorhodopirellula heiligendammensis]
MTPTDPEIKSIAGCPMKRAEIRQRLSSFSWWMRLLCQRVATRANREDEQSDPVGPCESASGKRCSDKGFWAMRAAVYLALLDWTAQQSVRGKHRTAVSVPPILVRLGLDRAT